MSLLNQRLPENPFLHRLPGTRPVAADEWLMCDEIYAAQMAYRAELLATRLDDVYRIDPGAEAAAEELLAHVIALVQTWPGYLVGADAITRPDGQIIQLNLEPPLITAARLVQEDLCILENRGGAEHLLTAGVLCFPASWSLDEKHMRSLVSIHDPVAPYDDRIARGVQRMFDALKPGIVLCRGNLLGYHDPELFTPRRENDRRGRPAEGEAPYLRAERQCLLKLPVSNAVVFTIHTYMVRTDTLSPDQTYLADELQNERI